MRRNSIILSFIIIFSWFSLSFAWNGQVIGVADGDTITVVKNGQKVKVRLYGIDTPEKRQPFGQKAKKFTNSLVRKKTVYVEPIDKDRYGRTVGLVYINGQNVNELLVKEGYAWVYRKYCRESFCDDWMRHEKQAQDGKLGLWADSAPVPPWEWRHKKKNDTAVADSMYHGNIKSKIFHKKSCRYYNCKDCVASFKKREKAISEGYRPCKLCKP
ncbi:thermonuclease family protein [Desulfolithobacter dissulfuricans]|uniref:thermonuclease family protein n=1 Tax=Desulfolithobacter dissulfuricans TaxID=2795293 RepID=UPI002277F4C8|nr:thermonuclease family protein [Desulfolithobacter dissulfuricans]